MQGGARYVLRKTKKKDVCVEFVEAFHEGGHLKICRNREIVRESRTLTYRPKYYITKCKS